ARPSALCSETTPPDELPWSAEKGPRSTSIRSAPARLKCESWPWPSGIEAGMPSAYSRSPRTPKVARAPKPRIESWVSWARFWRSRASRPGMPRSTSATSASAVARSPARPTVAVEAGASKAGTARRRVASTTTRSRVVASTGAPSGAPPCTARAAPPGAAAAGAAARASAKGRARARGAGAGAGRRRDRGNGIMRALSPAPAAAGRERRGRRCNAAGATQRPAPGSHVAVGGPALAGAAVVDGVGVEHLARGNRRLSGQARLERGEVGARGLHQLLEAVDDEVGLLVVVDAVARAHDPLEVEADAVGRRRLQAVHRLAAGRDDAAAVDAQPAGLADEPELHRVPVQPGQVLQRVRADGVRLDPAAAIGGHVVGEHRVHQQRHVAEEVVEEVRLLDVVDLLGAADPPGDREAPVGQVVEEVEFGQQALHADQAPAGGRLQHPV